MITRILHLGGRLASACLLTTLSTLFGSVTSAHAQHQVGARLGFANAPGGASFVYDLPSGHRLEGVFGHTKAFSRNHDNQDLFRRGAFVLGLAYQPVLYMGRGRDNGLYFNLGGRMRMHMIRYQSYNPEAGPRKNVDIFTPEVIGGAGLFVRLGETFEFFGELNGLFGSENGTKMAPNLETSCGVRVLLGRY